VTKDGILYLDSSALVKLYVDETGSKDVRRWVAHAPVATTSRVAHVEVAAAVARRVREQLMADDAANGLRAVWERDMERRLAVIDLSATIAAHAALLAEDYPLRGMDAIHLASALWIKGSIGSPVTFAVWDVRLGEAARHAGLDVWGV
jgi:predicted nucleic acid-binding protein